MRTSHSPLISFANRQSLTSPIFLPLSRYLDKSRYITQGAADGSWQDAQVGCQPAAKLVFGQRAGSGNGNGFEEKRIKSLRQGKVNTSVHP